MPKKKKELRRRKESSITCFYCKEYSQSKIVNGRRICRETGKAIDFRQSISTKGRTCLGFVPISCFACIKNGQRYPIITCLHRKNLIKHKKGLYLSYSKCKKCPQYKIIKEIANLQKMKPPTVVQLKRRKPKEEFKLKRREKIIIRRREKPKPKTIIRRRNGKQGK